MRERIFLLTGSKFDGNVMFKFNLNGYLILFKCNANLKDIQLKTLYKKIPLHLSQIKQLNDLGDVDLEEIPADLSFDTFWKEYANYAGKKKACRQMWEKLSLADKTSAMNGISIYKQRKAIDGTAIAYPDTYLRNRIWEN